jgi:hypothetical protein
VFSRSFHTVRFIVSQCASSPGGNATMGRASAWVALVDIFTTRSCLGSRESLAPAEHLSQSFAAFRLPFKDFFDSHQGRKKTPANRLCKKALRGFCALHETRMTTISRNPVSMVCHRCQSPGESAKRMTTPLPRAVGSLFPSFMPLSCQRLTA